jgi:outer membrane protein TolC
LPADLLSRRPDILAARARIDAATQGRTAAHADFYPNINLMAAIGFQAVGLASLFSADRFSMRGAFARNMPAPPPTWISRWPTITRPWWARCARPPTL